MIYATGLYRNAVESLKKQREGDQEEITFIDGILDALAENPDLPSHAGSQFFVACLSFLGDDVNQWLKYGGGHGENGYAIGF